MAEVEKMIHICGGECQCCIELIRSHIVDHAGEWNDMENKRLANTPLHQAAEVGNTAVVMEIMNLMPSLGRKLNEKWLSPLHVAVENEQIHTARALASFDKQLVRVKGKGGATPLMLCAALHSHHLLAILLLQCPNSVADVNNRNQTVVHVALENRHCDTVCVIIDWLKRTNQLSSVLSVKDDDGNTVLHTAAKFGCKEGAERIVNLVKLNKLNYDGKTALDVAEFYDNMNVAQVLKEKGAQRHSTHTGLEKTMVDYVLNKPSPAEAVSRAYYYLTHELTLELRSAVLVVATVIMAGTYQVVLQPPAGIYPPPQKDNMTAGAAPPPATNETQHMAGQMVMDWKQYHFFMPLNTFAFALSAVIIIFVVPGTPIFLILHVCLLFMCSSYLCALDAISFYTQVSNMILYMAMYAVFGAYLVKLLYYPFKSLLVEEDWWLPHFNVKFINWWERIGGHRSIYGWVAKRMKRQNLLLSRT